MALGLLGGAARAVGGQMVKSGGKAMAKKVMNRGDKKQNKSVSEESTQQDGGKSGALAIRPKTTLIPASAVKAPDTKTTSIGSDGILVTIYKKVVEIDKLLKGTLAEEKALTKEKIKQDKKEDRDKREGKLEKKKTKEEKKQKGLSLPGLSFFDRIKKFITTIITGFILQKLVALGPEKLEGIIKAISGGIEFVADLIIGIVDAAGTFLLWGQKAYDATEGFLRDKFGDGAASTFEGFMSNLNKAFNLIAIIGMTVAATNKFGGGKGGKGGQVKVKGSAQKRAVQRYAKRFGRDAAIKKFGKQTVQKFGGKFARSGATNLARKGVVSVLGKSGAKVGLKAVKNIISPIVKRIPIIGGLIDFAINYFIFKEPVGRAAFAAIGTTIFGALGATAGSIIPVAGNFVGGALGGLAGDMAGKWLYDTFFDKKELKKDDKPDAKPVSDPAATGGGASGGSGGAKKLGNFDVEKSNNIVNIGKDLISKGFSVAEHPDFTKTPTSSGGAYTPGKGTVSNVHSGRGHYEGRAIDVTDWRGSLEDSKGRYRNILDSVYNDGNMGNKLLIHDSWGIADQTGKNGPGAHGHPTHMHIEVKDKGGKIGKGLFANLGGPEFVLDNDSYSAIKMKYPGFLAALNAADGAGALKVLEAYASYEQGGESTVVINQNQLPASAMQQKQSSSAPLVIPMDSSDPAESLYAMS